MYMTVQCEQRLAPLDKSPHRDAPDVHVQCDVLMRLSVKSCPIQRGIVRRS